ncbi:MAG: hypothetical protein M1830_003080 [Pleopsidium flavum]|nr:MAG: hypothetical protein M1830_003080 [Pleopsidium flavum]
MVRTSKFSFPFPGRRSNTAKRSNLDEQLSQTTEEHTQIGNGKPTKAQILLGTSDFGGIYSKQKRPEALRTKPSFMSISVSELSQDFAMSSDEIHDHALVAEPPETPCQPPRRICPRPSSPLLGQQYHGSKRVGSSTTDLPNSGLRETRSSSTLRSYYDPIKSPLSVSQQTSASSARDMALRKGCTRITESQDHSSSESALTTAADPRSPKEKPSDEGSRKRPPRLDFSKLFSRPQTTHGVLLSPDKVTKSPLPLSVASDMVPSTPLHGKDLWSRKNKSNDSVSRSDQLSPYFRPPVEPTFKAKVSVRKPKQGIQNWFDGVDEENDLGHPDHDFKSSIKTMDCPPALAACSGTLAVPDRKSALSRSSQLTGTRQNPSPQPNPQHFRHNGIQLCFSQGSWEGNSIHSPSSPKSRSSKKSSESIFTGSNLQNQSVLALSSEDEDEVQAPMGSLQRGLHKGAASTNKNDNSIINRSGIVPIIQPVSTYKYSGSMLSSRSRSSASSVRHGVFPESSRSNTTTFSNPPSISYSSYQRPSGRWISESKFEDVRSKSSNAAASGSSTFLMGSVSPPASPPRSESMLPTRKSRIMAVTREEESLLEAMRHKRAIMRQGKSDQAYNQAPQPDPVRPSIVNAKLRMAGSGKRIRFVEEHMPPTSVSALLPAASGQVVSSAGSGFLDDTSTSSASLSNSALPMKYLSVSNSSPNIPSTPSDYESSTPTSRASPKTPPSEHASSKTSTDRTVMTMPIDAEGVSADIEKEHCSKQVVSSGLVELHTREEKAVVRYEQNDIVLWNMDG